MLKIKKCIKNWKKRFFYIHANRSDRRNVTKTSTILAVLAQYAQRGLCNCRASVCQSICPIRLLEVCYCGPSRQEISIDCCTAGGPSISSRGTARRSAAMRAVPNCQLTQEAEHRQVCTGVCCVTFIIRWFYWAGNVSAFFYSRDKTTHLHRIV